MKCKFIIIVLSGMLWINAQGETPPSAIVNDLLERGVKDGLVDYALFKENKKAVKAYVAILASNLSKQEQNKKAFVDWINLYNLLTIELIVEHYPNLRSIRDLKKPWGTPVITISNTALTLDDIEHKKLRGVFKDYRVHFVLVCASLGCPDLRDSLYTYQDIEKELEQETKKYLNSPKGTELQGKRLAISKLFSWYKKDFTPNVKDVLKKYLTNKDKLKALDSYFNNYLPYSYLDYSWSLNELKIKESKKGNVE